MERIVKIYTCDRCGEKHNVEQYTDGYYNYDLCETCSKVFVDYLDKVEELKREINKTERLYKFGKYLNKKE